MSLVEEPHLAERRLPFSADAAKEFVVTRLSIMLTIAVHTGAQMPRRRIAARIKKCLVFSQCIAGYHGQLFRVREPFSGRGAHRALLHDHCAAGDGTTVLT